MLVWTYEKREPWLLEYETFCTMRSDQGSNTPEISSVTRMGPATVTEVTAVSYVRQGPVVWAGSGCAGGRCSGPNSRAISTDAESAAATTQYEATTSDRWRTVIWTPWMRQL